MLLLKRGPAAAASCRWSLCCCCCFCVQVVNVLDEVYNPGVRDAIKNYSQWPTIPQVRVRLPDLDLSSFLIPFLGPFMRHVNCTGPHQAQHGGGSLGQGCARKVGGVEERRRLGRMGAYATHGCPLGAMLPCKLHLGRHSRRGSRHCLLGRPPLGRPLVGWAGP